MSDDELLAENYTFMINECINYYGENPENPESSMLNFVISETRKRVGSEIESDLVKKIDIHILKEFFPIIQKEYDLILRVAQEYTHMINECIEYYGILSQGIIKAIINETEYYTGNDITFESIKNRIHILKEYIPDLKVEYDLMISRKASNYKVKMLNPNPKYTSLIASDFGPVRSPNTTFDSNFKKRSPAILLYIKMHGAIALDKRFNSITSDRDIMLNKYNVSAIGQCAYDTEHRATYMVYSLSDALKNNTPLDIATMLREALANDTYNIVDTDKTFNETPSIKMDQTIENSKRLSTGRRHLTISDANRPEGEETAYGNEYAEKIYALDRDETIAGGIFICSEWPEIGAGPLDNLLENDMFKAYMLEKYSKKKRKNDFHELHNLGYLRNSKSLIERNKKNVIDGILLTDIVFFCKTRGRPNINIVDVSCSAFMQEHTLSPRQIDMIEKRLKKLGPTVAKGVKKKDKRKKTNKKTNKKKGNQKTKRRY